MSDDGDAGTSRFFDYRSPHLDRFVPLLGLAILALATMSLVDLRNPDGTAWRRVVGTLVGLLIGATLLLALRASGVKRRWRIAAFVFFLVGAVVSLVVLVVGLVTDEELSMLSTDRPSVIWVAIAAVTPLAVIRRLLKHRDVSPGTMLGAIAGYLLIGLAFCYVLLFIAGFASEDEFLAGADSDATTAYMYFSLVSLTTVGYGDVTAATDLGRFIATSEAVIGQVYLVTFVAMLVGLMIQSRQQQRG